MRENDYRDERKRPKRDFDVEATETILRKTTIESDNYNVYFDEDRGTLMVDTDPVEFYDDYQSQHWSIVELVNHMRGLIEKWRPSDMSKKDKAEYDRILEEAEGWELEDFEITDHE